MRTISLVAAATLSVLVLSGAPAAYATDLPDIPVAVGVPSAVSDAAGTGASYECTTKSSLGPTETEPKASDFCVYHTGGTNEVAGYMSFDAPAYGAGTQVFYDLYVYRCRASDNVCVVISSATGTSFTDDTGHWHTWTDFTTQTWSGRYYKACAALSTELGWGYGNQCTSRLIP